MDKKPTILVIDDEPSIRMGLAATIRRYGYEVITAVNGDDGFLKARQFLPDLIVSDVMMPDLNGFEMRKQMGADPLLASVPFIFLTARTTHEDRVTGIRIGADDYVTKPFVTDELMGASKQYSAASRPYRSGDASRGDRPCRRSWRHFAARFCRTLVMNCGRRWATS